MGQTEPMSRPGGVERAAAEIVFDEATKRYGDGEPAVDHLSLTVPAGEICVLVGPSGGGKTTALKLVNRLIELTSGDIRIDGTSVNALDVTELRRGIGYVIQQVGLFPHMTIEANIGTVPRLFGWLEGADPHAVAGAARARRARHRRTRSAIPRSSRAASGSASALARALAANPPRDADGRAVRRDRPDRARTASGRVPAPPAGSAEDRRLRHARHRRGDQDRRPDRDPPPGRQARPVRHAGGDPREARPTTSSRSSSAPTARSRRSRCARSASSSCARRPTAARALPRSTTLRDALALLIAEHAQTLAVTDDAGAVVGSLTRDDLLR